MIMTMITTLLIRTKGTVTMYMYNVYTHHFLKNFSQMPRSTQLSKEPVHRCTRCWKSLSTGAPDAGRASTGAPDAGRASPQVHQMRVEQVHRCTRCW